MKDIHFEYEKHSNAPVETGDLLSGLKRVAKEVGKVSQSVYAEKGRYDCSTVIRRFGTWNNALKKVGIGLREFADAVFQVQYWQKGNA